MFGWGGLLPVASTVAVTTRARDTSHPNTNAAPFLTPRLEGSTTRNADSGSGSSAITSADDHKVKDHGRPFRLAPAGGVLMLAAPRSGAARPGGRSSSAP